MKILKNTQWYNIWKESWW